ncbi:CheR family methyltransferase [Nocardia sp. BMG51109]|uniref:CheR family methyltransferase n=1 Tax=Nocardia sp. BMG51109 TaxID=1056816 RepID=UPI00046598C1|nr:CheR family methyltransferase [Nocardia sp. BMG51109]
MTGSDAAADRDDSNVDGTLEDLLIFIRDSRGFDFTGYKRSSLARRIRKRMHEVRIDKYSDYRDYLETNADEFRYLFNTILINVTSFFRDIDAWQYLQREILPELLTTLDPGAEIRIWSAGCSSGEEAYSLAIALAEVLGIDEAVKRVKIYGTDVDEEALRDARTGMYSAKALEALSSELRDRYFEANGDKFIFRSDLRRRVIFGRHDITRDAPISRLDLLVCRNTLMYFNVEAQSQIVDRYHFALREGGFLFLGKAEMLLSDGERFEVAHMRQRIFRRRGGVTGTMQTPAAPRLDIGLGQEVQGAVKRRMLSELALESTPVAMVGVDIDGKVAVANSQMRNMFGLTQHDVGRPLSELEISYRPVELRSLIEQAVAEHRVIRVNSVERRVGPDDIQFFDVHVQPLWSGDGPHVGVIVSFVDTTVSTRLSVEVKNKREELETAYEELQSTNEELETTNEELQSSIEELETTNEELQSTNEELETTNEELQSGNEELETMNEELRIRSGELDEARGFLEGILSSVGAGVVVLDGDLRVRSWNRGAEELWGLRADEVRHQLFTALDFGLPTEQLHDTIKHTLETGHRSNPVDVPAVNRIGRSIVCAVTCTIMDGIRDAVVLLMEEQPVPPAAQSDQ